MSQASSRPSPWRIILSDLDYGREEEEAIIQVIRSKWLSMGAITQSFETMFATEVGVTHAIAVASATAGLMLSFLALGIGPGDEIIQPAINFVAAANTTIRIGARPVFADSCRLAEPTLAPAELERCLTPSTRAVVVMHYGGAPCRMREIKAFCRDHNLFLIEDACHGIGGSYEGRKMGAWGELAVFSFFSNKNLATGGGGMITTNDDALAERLRLLRSHGMTTLTWERHRGHAATYDVIQNGLNCRMDELHSAIGCEQLKKLGRNNQRRRELARSYHQLINQEFNALLQRGWTIPELGVYGEEAAHHLMVVLAPDTETRNKAMLHLRDQGIQTSIHYPFIPGFSAFRSDEANQSRVEALLPNAAAFCSRVLTLPMHPLLSTADIRLIVSVLAEMA